MVKVWLFVAVPVPLPVPTDETHPYKNPPESLVHVPPNRFFGSVEFQLK